MNPVKFTLLIIMAILIAALIAMLVWPGYVFLIWLGLMALMFGGLWFQHRRWPQHSLLLGWRELFFGR